MHLPVPASTICAQLVVMLMHGKQFSRVAELNFPNYHIETSTKRGRHEHETETETDRSQ